MQPDQMTPNQQEAIYRYCAEASSVPIEAIRDVDLHDLGNGSRVRWTTYFPPKIWDTHTRCSRLTTDGFIDAVELWHETGACMP